MEFPFCSIWEWLLPSSTMSFHVEDSSLTLHLRLRSNSLVTSLWEVTHCWGRTWEITAQFLCPPPTDGSSPIGNVHSSLLPSNLMGSTPHPSEEMMTHSMCIGEGSELENSFDCANVIFLNFYFSVVMIFWTFYCLTSVSELEFS